MSNTSPRAALTRRQFRILAVLIVLFLVLAVVLLWQGRACSGTSCVFAFGMLLAAIWEDL